MPKDCVVVLFIECMIEFGVMGGVWHVFGGKTVVA